MSYENIRFFLEKKYKKIIEKEETTDNKKNYYVDKEGKVVATISDCLIVLYVDDALDDNNTQYQKLIRVVPKNPKIKPVRLNLIGMYNDAKIEDEKVELDYNDELDRMCAGINTEKMSQRNLSTSYSIYTDTRKFEKAKKIRITGITYPLKKVR